MSTADEQYSLARCRSCRTPMVFMCYTQGEAEGPSPMSVAIAEGPKRVSALRLMGLKKPDYILARRLLHRRRRDDGIMTTIGRLGGVQVEFQPMSPEDVQRTMQFLVNQQAQFAADFARTETYIDKLSGKIDEVTEKMSGLTSLVGGVTSAVGGLTSVLAGVMDSVSQLAAAQDRTDEQIKETGLQLEQTDRQLKETDQQLKETDQRLSEVIRIVDRHLRDDHGHGPS